MDAVTKALLEQGVVGIMALVAFAFGYKMYRDSKASQNLLLNKCDQWMEAYLKLAMALQEVMAALKDELERRSK